MPLKNSSLCNQFKLLAKTTFRMLGKARQVNHQFNEETITDYFVFKLKEWKTQNIPSKFNIRTFFKRQEGINGADFEWDWYFTDENLKTWVGFRIQAKVLKLSSNKFESFSHSNQNGVQHNLLTKSSNTDNRIPFYCFYLHKHNESPLKA